MTEPAAKPARLPKFTMMLDPVTRAYQKRIKYECDVHFSEFIRAAVERVSSDPELENEVLRLAGGSVPALVPEVVAHAPEESAPVESSVPEEASAAGFWDESEYAT